MNSRYSEEEGIKQRLSERAISYFIGKYVKVKYRIWMLRKESNESRLHPADISRVCLEHIFPVTSPLALISQIRGSGGSFLNQLFDGHPELHTHPEELMIGYPVHDWPRIDLNERPENWFGILFEDTVREYIREGYRNSKKGDETFPFVFFPSLQRKIFLDYINSLQPITQRDVFDAYMTSYFRAWLNNQNYNGQKKFITALNPRLQILKENTELFFETYPDGRLISLVRDPQYWFPFARIHWPKKYEDVTVAVSQWNESAQAMLWNKEKYGDSVCLITFKDLVNKTEAVMRYLAGFLGIEFDDILLVPTFNKYPSTANARFREENRDTWNGPLSGVRKLAEHEVTTIEKETSEIYTLALREVVTFG